jgi:NitT/TauT family transport system permease protein
LRRTARTALDQVLPWLSLAAGLVLWEAVGRSRVFSFVPSLGEVLAAFWSMVQTGKLDALGATLQALAIGYGLSVVLGIATGVAMARSRLIKYVLDPYINAFMTIPSSALIPLYLVLFGLGAETRVVVVFMHAYFVVVVNTIAGAQTTPADLLEMARAFGAGEAALVRKVVVPSALPLVLTGLRLGFGRAVRGIINGETILASVGIGQLLIRYGRTFQMDYLYGVVLTIVLLAVVGTTTIGIIERRTTRWQHA